MLDLALSVFFASLIFVIFKLFSIYKVETLYAIITNYIVASIYGFTLYKGTVTPIEIPEKKWFLGTLILGVLFIVVFKLMAATAQKVGVSVASVSTKMSLVIPVIFGVLVYNEELGGLKILGIILALASVYFTSFKEQSLNVKRTSLLLPFLVFLGSGIIDTTLNFMQEKHIQEAELPLFSATIFAFAATTGIVFIAIKTFKTPLKVNYRNTIGGIALGVINYYSIFFLMRALQNDTLNSASIFTINNVAIVMFSTLLGILLFKEHLSIKNWGGIVLAIISILLVALF
ncbi:DMT family transporter [Aurantibacter crassamenti]|uniref:GRP family sugar transporter n=1 Tax=Aurantibacter crassamenti TaxID=1837375 RepID=UPI00193A15A3|nr:GRP family sugar transporter [Aurantibacter crassamenti]MBM1107516.1 DMT family transporter [Aurantibacter crassamenti]